MTVAVLCVAVWLAGVVLGLIGIGYFDRDARDAAAVVTWPLSMPVLALLCLARWLVASGAMLRRRIEDSEAAAIERLYRTTQENGRHRGD